MAIYASVKYRSLRAGVAHRKLQLSASIQKASAVVVQQNVVASITSRKVATAISFAKLTTVTSWQNLYLHDVHVNAERTIFLLDDAYAFLDSAVFAVDKGLSDSFGFSSQAAFTVGKQLTDTTSLSDLARFDAGKAASDDFSFLDGVAFDASTQRVDEFGFSDNVHTAFHAIRQHSSDVDILESLAIDTTKANDDDIIFTDSASSHPNKGAADSATLSDAQTFGVNTHKQSVFAISDVASSHPNKGVTDSLAFADSQNIDVNSVAQSSITFAETTSAHPNKGLADTFGFADIKAFGVNARRQSSFTTLDQLTVTRQPYNFVFSQSGDVVTVTGEPDDSFGFTDGINSFSVSKALQDYFALDDFAQINKDVEGVKSNVFGFTEYLESSFGKVIESELFTVTEQASFSLSKPFADSASITEALGLHPSRLSTDETTLSDVATLSSSSVKTDSAPITDTLESNVGKAIENQLFSLTDQALFALSKPVADSIIVEELLTFHASKSATDTTALNDAATLSPWIGKSDSTPIVDSLDVEHVVTGALLNQAMIGNIILNAD